MASPELFHHETHERHEKKEERSMPDRRTGFFDLNFFFFFRVFRVFRGESPSSSPGQFRGAGL
jgi:hypothetical protein